MTTPSRNLRRLAFAVQHGRAVDRGLADWFADAVQRWRCEPALSLEAALGLRRNHEDLKTRDDRLAEVASLMPHHWTGRERVRQIQAAAHNLSTFSDLSAVDWSNRPAWHAPLALALRAAPLPGDRRLFDLCNLRESCTKSVV